AAHREFDRCCGSHNRNRRGCVDPGSAWHVGHADYTDASVVSYRHLTSIDIRGFAMWTLFWLMVVQMTVPLEPTARPKVTAQEIARGRTLFEAQCAYCHGADGDGGRGANLARAALRH